MDNPEIQTTLVTRIRWRTTTNEEKKKTTQRVKKMSKTEVKRERKQNGQHKMDNPEIQTTIVTRNRPRTNKKKQHRELKRWRGKR